MRMLVRRLSGIAVLLSSASTQRALGAASCFVRLKATNASTCESQGLASIASREECQEAFDFVNAVEDALLRPGGPVVQSSYNFHPQGCFSTCEGEHHIHQLPHYFCGRFNSNISVQDVKYSAGMYMFCAASDCCTCLNGFPAMDGCPRNECRACYRGYTSLVGSCWPDFIVQSGIVLAVLGVAACVGYGLLLWHRANGPESADFELALRSKAS